MAARTEDELLEALNGDFRGLLDNKRVSREVQATLSRRGIDSTEMLDVMADDRESLREVARTQLQIDPAVDPNQAVIQARLVVAWEAARQRMQIRGEKDAHAASEREARSIPTNEFLGLWRQFERQYYELRDEEVPSRNSLEDLAEQLESGDWRAMSLKEIAAKSDVESDSQWSSLTVGKLGQVRLKKSAVETAAPKDLEEYRQKLKLLGHHFVFLRMMHPSRREIGDVTPFTFTSFADYMLSKRVAKLASEDENGQVFHHPTLLHPKEDGGDLATGYPSGSILEDCDGMLGDQGAVLHHGTSPLPCPSVRPPSQRRLGAVHLRRQQRLAGRGQRDSKDKDAKGSPRREKEREHFTPLHQRAGRSATPSIHLPSGATARATVSTAARCASGDIRLTSTQRKARRHPEHWVERARNPRPRGQQLDGMGGPGYASCICMQGRSAKRVWAKLFGSFAHRPMSNSS